MQRRKTQLLRISLLCFCIGRALLVCGQGLDDYAVSGFKDSTSRPLFDADAYRLKMKAKYKDVISNATSLDNYANLLTEDALHTYRTQYIYENWGEAEAFLLKVLKRAAPENVVDPSVRIYVVRDADVNAWCAEDGTIFVNVGFLATVETEAELATVLCHELGHYLNFHSYKRYENEVNARNTAIAIGHVSYMGARITMASHRLHLKEQEEEADDLIVKAFSRNGYRKEDAVQIFTRFRDVEALERRSRDARLPLFYISTHPATPDRIAKMQAIPETGGTRPYLVDSAYFHGLRQRAANERIYLLFNRADYRACLYYAFREHACSPAGQFYLFYVLESLRRLCLLNEGMEKDYFLTGNYVLDEVKEARAGQVNTDGKVKIGRSLFFHWQDLYPGLDTRNQNNALFRNDTLEFVTNADALRYFAEQSAAKCPDCFLSLKMMGRPYSPPAGTGELSRYYWSVAKALDTFTGTAGGEERVPVVLNGIYSTQGGGAFNQLPFTSTWQLRADYRLYAEDRTGLKPLMFNHALLPSEQASLLPELDQLETYYFQKTGVRGQQMGIKNLKERRYETVPVETLHIFPELAMLAQKYGFKRIIFFDLVMYTQTGQSFHESYQTQTNMGTVYCVDLDRKTISCAKSAASSGANSSVRSVVAGLEPLFLEFAK